MEERRRKSERDLLIPNTEHSPHAKLSHSHSPILIQFASFTVSLPLCSLSSPHCFFLCLLICASLSSPSLPRSLPPSSAPLFSFSSFRKGAVFRVYKVAALLTHCDNRL